MTEELRGFEDAFLIAVSSRDTERYAVLPITAGKEFPERRTVSHLVQHVSLYFLFRRTLLMIPQQNLFL